MQTVLAAARAQPDNAANKEFTGYLQRQQAAYYFLQGNLPMYYQHFIMAYENTGLASILVEIIEIEARLGAFESAENLLSILEERNTQLRGAETVLVNKAKQMLEEIRQQVTRARAAQAATPVAEPLPAAGQ